MKTLKSLIYGAQIRKEMWEDRVNDQKALSELGKTKEEAQNLVSYFEGKFDAYCYIGIHIKLSGE